MRYYIVFFVIGELRILRIDSFETEEAWWNAIRQADQYKDCGRNVEFGWDQFRTWSEVR